KRRAGGRRDRLGTDIAGAPPARSHPITRRPATGWGEGPRKRTERHGRRRAGRRAPPSAAAPPIGAFGRARGRSPAATGEPAPAPAADGDGHGPARRPAGRVTGPLSPVRPAGTRRRGLNPVLREGRDRWGSPAEGDPS